MKWWLGLLLVGCTSSPPRVVEVPASPPPLPPPVARNLPERVTLQVEKVPPVRVAPPVISPTARYSRVPQAVRINDVLPARVQPSVEMTRPLMPQSSVAHHNEQLRLQMEQRRAWTRARNQGLMEQPSAVQQNAQVFDDIEQQKARIQARNQALSSQGLLGPSGVSSPSVRQLEDRYYQAQADFLNTKYCSHGPPRWTAQSARGDLSSIAPPNPAIMSQPNPYNPVIQKYQQAQAARQELRRASGSNYP